MKFLRYRGHHDQVPIIKPAVREARLDHAPRFQNHEESYRVSNESCQTSSRLVQEIQAREKAVLQRQAGLHEFLRLKIGGDILSEREPCH